MKQKTKMDFDFDWCTANIARSEDGGCAAPAAGHRRFPILLRRGVQERRGVAAPLHELRRPSDAQRSRKENSPANDAHPQLLHRPSARPAIRFRKSMKH